MARYVYRMQNEGKRGPYRLDYYDYDRPGFVWSTRSHEPDDRPAPHEDPGMVYAWRIYCETTKREDKNYRFGFVDKAQAYRWFNCPVELDLLEDFGFKLCRVRAVEIIAQSDKQLVYIPEEVSP